MATTTTSDIEYGSHELYKTPLPRYGPQDDESYYDSSLNCRNDCECYGTTHGTYSRYNVFRVASDIAIAQLLTITTMPNANMCTARHRESLRRGLPQKLPSKQLL